MWLRHESFIIAYSVPLHKQDLPTAQSPRFAGKKVFVIRRQQAARQTIAAAAINLFINFYGIAAPAMPSGYSVSLRSLSCCLRFLLIPHGSYCVLHAPSFISSFVTLHYTTFVANPFASRLGPAIITHNLYTEVGHQPFASQHYNTHWVSFRFTTSFIHFSSVQSTRCPLLLCSPAAPLRLRSPCGC